MRFEDVIGHGALKERLKQNIASGRISHAVMFTGNIGSGILPMATAFASEIIVQHSEHPDSARHNCDKLIHADLHFSYPVSTNTSITKDPIALSFIKPFREAFLANPYLSALEWMEAAGIEKKVPIISAKEAESIANQLSLKAYEGGYKVMVLWLPETMHASAANKLLKLLEEPPPKTVFSIACESPESLLPTILSRVQIIRVPPISEEELKTVLIEKHLVEPSVASSLALVAEGSYTYALEALNKENDEGSFKEDFRSWMRMLYAKKIHEILQFVEVIARQSRVRQTLFLKYGLHIFRESLIMNYGAETLQRLDETEKEFVHKFSPFINAANALLMTEEFEQGIKDINRNANGKILFLDLSLKAMKLIRLKPET